MTNNFYDTLGVSKNASADDIRRAYRKLAAEHHPDRGGKAERFKEINEAYQVLSDSAKRSQYDQYGQTFEQAQRQGGFAGGNPFSGGFDFSGGFGNGFGGAEFDLGDIFSGIFGGAESRAGRGRGIDLEMPLDITFAESIFGVTKEVALEKQNSCAHCGGSGAEKGSKVITCPKCHGQGQIRTTRKTILGNIASAVSCDRCSGSGKVPEKPCGVCGGSGAKRGQKTIRVNIPAGIDDGQRIRVSGEGEAGYRGSGNGDLYIVIRVQKDQHFVRRGYDLFSNLNIGFAEAALGTAVMVRTVDGETKIKIPGGTQPGKVFRVSGKGVPHLHRPGKGDLYVTVNVKVPQKLSKQQKEALKKWQQLEKDNF